MENFNKIKEEVLSYKNELGQKVDEGIVDLLVGLKLNGFHTSSSCSGHCNQEGRLAPSVIIHSKNMDLEKDDSIYDYVEENLQVQKDLIDLLDEFYKNSKTPHKHRFICVTLPACMTELTTLSSYTTDIIKDMKERAKIYNICQKELKEFSKFLLEKYKK